jgi:hypothetical protein
MPPPRCNIEAEGRMLTRIFHSWERRLAAVSTDRVVRPFDWGADWLPPNGPPEAPAAQRLAAWVDEAMADTGRFFATAPADDYRLAGSDLTFSSAVATPHPENNTVHARWFPSAASRGRAVLVLPQWNASAEGHAGLCRLLSRVGLSALRLTLPYHEQRMPPDLTRADYIVSANLARTLQVCRQAVLDARRAVAWLAAQGHERIGILGTSLGSCLSMLAMAHEPLIRTAALNHISPYFADVVWSGLSTAHVRQGLEGHVGLEELRRLWMPISPFPYLPRVKDRRILLIYARYDLTFPVDLSRMLLDEFRRQAVPHRVAVLPCGHYSTGISPFKWMDGWLLVRFLRRNL